MSVVRFQVSTRYSGRLRTMRVCVYDTLKELRTAGESWSWRLTGRRGDFRKAGGAAQSCYRVSVSRGGRVRRKPSAGFIRLWRKTLCAEVIAHEASHMALAIYRQDVGKTIPDMQREEILAYLSGQISGRIVNGLYRHKVLKKAGA